jgi:predicted TIM-barrel enzyme
MLEVADGAIVGTSIKQEGVASNAVDPQRAVELVRAARGLPL